MRNGIPAALVAAALAMLAACEGGTGPTTAYEYGGKSAGQQPGLRYQFDANGDRVWWLTRDGVVVKNVGAMERTAVTIPGWTWVKAAWSCPPDLALGPSGEAVVTSNIVPIVWKIDPKTMAVTEGPEKAVLRQSFGIIVVAQRREDKAEDNRTIELNDAVEVLELLGGRVDRCGHRG